MKRRAFLSLLLVMALLTALTVPVLAVNAVGEKTIVCKEPDDNYNVTATYALSRPISKTESCTNSFGDSGVCYYLPKGTTITSTVSGSAVDLASRTFYSDGVNGGSGVNVYTPFADVSSSSYYLNSVLWAVDKVITNGTSATTFSPSATCTHGQIITFLWRAAGSPVPTGSVPVSDVSADDYYYKAVQWAYAFGMTSGSSFNPGSPCTRGMTVDFMWKAANRPNPAAASFTDVPAGSQYAAAVAWALDQGVTSGTSNTTFSPDATCTRSQVATFLYCAAQ